MPRTRTGFHSIPEGQLYWVHDVADSASTRARPTLLFIHAGVADHAQWDEQVSYFTARGWNTLRYDVLGYGKSMPSQEYLDSNPRPTIYNHEHAAHLLKGVLGSSPKIEVIVTGLSRGGGAALDLAISHPELIAGLVVAAGNVDGFDYLDQDPREEAVFQQEAPLVEENDIEGLAKLNVRLWADGPLQEAGRAFEEVREKIYRWCLDICRRECDKTGGSALGNAGLQPPAGKRLDELKIPVAVALGSLDERCTSAGMRYLAKEVKHSEIKEFNTAHMINMEASDEYNSWFETWLDKNF